MAAITTPVVRTMRLGLRATQEQETAPRCAAAQTLLDQRLLMILNEQYQALLDLLDGPGTRRPRLARSIFAARAMASANAG